MGKSHRDKQARGGRIEGAKPNSKYGEKVARREAAISTHGAEPMTEGLVASIPCPAPKRITPSKQVFPVARDPEGSVTRVMKTTSFQGCGKIIYMDAIKNDRGEALRIAEVSKGKRTIILIPAELVAQFEESLGKVTPALTL